MTYWSDGTAVVERHVGKDDALAVVETNVHAPFLPIDRSAIHPKTNTFRLGDVDRLEVVSEAYFRLDGLSVVVRGRSSIERSPSFRDINVDYLLSFNVLV